MICFCADFQRLSEGLRAGGEQHELLESEFVAGMGSTIDDVECGAGKYERRLDASEVSEVLVERYALFGGGGLCNSNRDTEDSVCTKISLVGCVVEFDEEIVNVLLRRDVQTRLDQLRSDDVVDVGNSLAYALKSGREGIEEGLIT